MSFLRTVPPYPAARDDELVLAGDPGENAGFCLLANAPISISDFHVARRPILWLGSDPFQAVAAVQRFGGRARVVLEDQYHGKGSADSRTTLSQRAGFLAGLFAGICPPEDVVFVKPKVWYARIGMPSRCTKQVCCARIEASLDPQEREVLEAQATAHRLDVLAAIGIGWAYSLLSDPEIKRGRKLLAVMKEIGRLNKPASTRKRSRKTEVAVRRAAAKVKA